MVWTKNTVPEGRTVSSEFCVQVMERLLKFISRWGPQFRDNARRCPCIFWHNSVALPGEWRRGGYHSPAWVTYVFPKGRVCLIRRRFQDVEDMIKNVTAELQFRWTPSMMWQLRSGQGRLLWRKIEHDLLCGLVCLFSLASPQKSEAFDNFFLELSVKIP
jgi:hypothetical protein